MTQTERIQIEELAQDFLRLLLAVMRADRAWATVTLRVEDGKLQWPMEVKQTVK